MKIKNPKNVSLIVLSLLLAVCLSVYVTSASLEKKFDSMEATVKACDITNSNLEKQMSEFCEGFDEMPFRVVKCGERYDVCLCGSTKDMMELSK